MWSTKCPAELVGDREAGQWAVGSHGLPTPALIQGALALTLALRAEHKYPLAGDDLEFVVFAAAGHLNGGQGDHTLREGVLEREPGDTQAGGTQSCVLTPGPAPTVNETEHSFHSGGAQLLTWLLQMLTSVM